MLEILMDQNTGSRKVDLKRNEKKTKVMWNTEDRQIRLRTDIIERVKYYIFLVIK